MITLPLTLEARIKLGYLLIQQVGSLEDQNMWEEICKKIKPTDAEREAIGLKEQFAATGDLQAANWNPWAIEELAATTNVEIETEHAKKLLAFMTNFQGFRKTDRVWGNEVRATLKALV